MVLIWQCPRCNALLHADQFPHQCECGATFGVQMVVGDQTRPSGIVIPVQRGPRDTPEAQNVRIAPEQCDLTDDERATAARLLRLAGAEADG